MRRHPALGLVLLFAGAAACSSTEPSATDPFGIDAGASVQPLYSDPQMRYPVCTADDSHRCAPVDDVGWRGSYGFAPEDGCWEACQCRHACEADADCPVPFSGSVAPRCVAGTCVLPCGDDAVCPMGMQCAESESLGAAWCMWVTQTAPCD